MDAYRLQEINDEIFRFKNNLNNIQTGMGTLSVRCVRNLTKMLKIMNRQIEQEYTPRNTEINGRHERYNILRPYTPAMSMQIPIPNDNTYPFRLEFTTDISTTDHTAISTPGLDMVMNMTYDTISQIINDSLDDHDVNRTIDPIQTGEALSPIYIQQMLSKKYKIKQTNEPEKCVICLDNFKNKERVRELPCTHCFHKKCVDRWFKNNSTCPMCRQNVKEMFDNTMR